MTNQAIKPNPIRPLTWLILLVFLTQTFSFAIPLPATPVAICVVVPASPPSPSGLPLVAVSASLRHVSFVVQNSPNLPTDEGLTAEYDITGTLIKSYGYEPDSTWGTNPLFQQIPTGLPFPPSSSGEETQSLPDLFGQSIPTTTYFYHNDHRGAPVSMTEANGHVVWEGTYDAFGNINITTEEVENNLRLPGQYFDSETGLYYNWNRYYDPTLGRHLRTDPEGEGLNHYAYVFANPHSGIDPMGLHTLGKAWDIMAKAWDVIKGIFETTAKWGQEAMGKWMDYAINADSAWKKVLGYGMAGFASLWTPDTWEKTFTVLTLASGINAVGKAAGWFGAGARRGALSAEASGAWKLGDDVYAPTATGNAPSWSTVRSRFWKNEASSSNATEKYGVENLERMRKGRAPQRFNPDKGGVESMELSHEPIPAREGGTKFVPRWPQDHAGVDPFRRPGY